MCHLEPQLGRARTGRQRCVMIDGIIRSSDRIVMIEGDDGDRIVMIESIP